MAQAAQNNDQLSGIIEVDAFFIANSGKGSNTLAHNKTPRKRGGNIDKRTTEG